MDLDTVVPQIITAISTLLGIGLTLWFTGRGERNRWESQVVFEREKMGMEALRDACLRYLKGASNMRWLYSEHHNRIVMRDHQDYLDQRSRLADEFNDAWIELELLFPSLLEAMKATSAYLAILDDDDEPLPDNEFDQHETNYIGHIDHVKDLMRKRLVTDPKWIANHHITRLGIEECLTRSPE